MWRDDAYLLDMLPAARRVIKFTQEIKFSQFQIDEIIQNAVMHQYFDIIPSKVWEVVQKDIPELIKILEPLVPPPDEPES
ncbi:MAG: DUF86 domain-containing protein [Sedimentisphaerales bacterium]|nr:DUF86 domain-containing protein [Sedimentisphaerales bacterium]